MIKFLARSGADKIEILSFSDTSNLLPFGEILFVALTNRTRFPPKPISERIANNSAKIFGQFLILLNFLLISELVYTAPNIVFS